MFATPVLSSVAEYSNANMTIVDIDGNNKLDFVISGTTSGMNNGTDSLVYENISIPGLVRFGDVISLGLSRAYTPPVFRDLDNDGKNINDMPNIINAANNIQSVSNHVWLTQPNKIKEDYNDGMG